MIKRKNLFALILILLLSCKKDKEDINMSLLHSYYFVDSHVNEYQNNIKNNDTIRLSFENNDTLKSFYFHYGTGQVLNKIDTGYKKYFIDNNKVYFAWFVDKLQGVDYDHMTGTWNIQVLNSDTLLINCFSDSGEILSHFGYSTKKK